MEQYWTKSNTFYQLGTSRSSGTRRRMGKVIRLECFLGRFSPKYVFAQIGHTVAGTLPLKSLDTWKPPTLYVVTLYGSSFSFATSIRARIAVGSLPLKNPTEPRKFYIATLHRSTFFLSYFSPGVNCTSCTSCNPENWNFALKESSQCEASKIVRLNVYLRLDQLPKRFQSRIVRNRLFVLGKIPVSRRNTN